MSKKLPYLSTPGTIDNAFKKVKAAATPPTFNNDFVHSKLQIRGGTGKAITPFFKKIGLVSESGTPTALYKQFRNTNSDISESAIAKAIRHGYRPLYEANEYCHELSDKDLLGLILQVTGLEDDNRSAALMKSTFLKLKSHANFDVDVDDVTGGEQEEDEESRGYRERLGDLRIGYTINLNLPPSTNPEVFDAIFQSLRKNLLRDD